MCPLASFDYSATEQRLLLRFSLPIALLWRRKNDQRTA